MSKKQHAMIFFDERNKGSIWVDKLRDKVEASDFYDESVEEAEELFNKYIKPNMDN